MSDRDQDKLTRMRRVLDELLRHNLGKSLEQVQQSLDRWRDGRLDVMDAHAQVLRHAARAERMAGRIANATDDLAGPVLRDAFDAGLIGRDEFIELTGSPPEDIEPAGSMDESLALPNKNDFINDLLAQGPVLVHADARVRGVSVPLQLKQDPRLVLRFGHGLTPAIPDLTIDDDALSGTLTFSGVPHHCVLPWPAVYAAVSESEQRGMVWPEDIPDVVLKDLEPSSPRESLTGKGPVPARATPITRKPAKPDKRRASHLKLVE